MANTLDVERFYEAMAKILGKKLGIKIEYKIVKREPSDGDALFRVK